MSAYCDLVGRIRTVALGLMISTLLASCGSGGGADVEVAPTALPQVLAVDAPAALQEVTMPVTFTSNVLDPDRRLAYAWSFGDGTASTSPVPTYTYTKPGEYRVTLTVTNEAGANRTAMATVRLAHLANVDGKVCSGGGRTGWCWQRPLPQGNTIHDTVFIDGLRGWAVGDSGTILATTDGGATWKAQASGTQSALYKVAFADPLVGWAAGAYGEVLRTVNGGATWQSFSVGRASPIQSLGVADANRAWVITNDSALGTTDGGAHWQSLLVPSAAFVRLLAVSAPDVLWAVPSYSGQPNVVRSTDGGRTWVDGGIPPAPTGFSRYGPRMQFMTARLGTFSAEEYGSAGNAYTSRQVAWQTADAGASWQRVDLSTAGANLYSADLQVVANRAAFLLAGGTRLQRTVDLGASWLNVPLPQGGTYWSSYRAYSPTELTITDWTGRMYLTTDAGTTWVDRSAGSTSLPTVNSVWFFDARQGLALARDGSSIRTRDGGQTWTTTAPVSGGQGWTRMQFAASGAVGWVLASSGIYRSTDKGRTWLAPVRETSAELPYGVSDFHFVDETNGWAISRYWSGDSPLFRSRDGGMSWQAVPNTRVLAGTTTVRFADPLNGVATGIPGVAWVTADGGSTWTARPTGTGSALVRLAFSDATTVTGVGDRGTLFRSTDRGLNWTRIALASEINLRDLRFVSSAVGYAAGDSGTLLKTTDAGMTWALLATSTNRDLESVYFLDEQTGWVVGEGGTVMGTATGGR